MGQLETACSTAFWTSVSAAVVFAPCETHANSTGVASARRENVDQSSRHIFLGFRLLYLDCAVEL